MAFRVFPPSLTRVELEGGRADDWVEFVPYRGPVLPEDKERSLNLLTPTLIPTPRPGESKKTVIGGLWQETRRHSGAPSRDAILDELETSWDQCLQQRKNGTHVTLTATFGRLYYTTSPDGDGRNVQNGSSRIPIHDFRYGRNIPENARFFPQGFPGESSLESLIQRAGWVPTSTVTGYRVILSSNDVFLYGENMQEEEGPPCTAPVHWLSHVIKRKDSHSLDVRLRLQDTRESITEQGREGPKLAKMDEEILGVIWLGKGDVQSVQKQTKYFLNTSSFPFELHETTRYKSVENGAWIPATVEPEITVQIAAPSSVAELRNLKHDLLSGAMSILMKLDSTFCVA